jgi:hypothetical protein
MQFPLNNVSATDAEVDFDPLTARLEAAAFQNRAKSERAGALGSGSSDRTG